MTYYKNGGLANIAQNLAKEGRYGDTQLVHMSPGEVQGLQALAKAQGTSLTVNPTTGLPEAFNFRWENLIPMAAGAALTVGSGGTLTPLMAAGLVGGGYGLATGSIEKGLIAGLGAYGGAGIGSGLASAGASTAEGAVAQQVARDTAGAKITEEAAKTAALEGTTLPADYSQLAAQTATPQQIAAAKTTGQEFAQAGRGIESLGTSEGRSAFYKGMPTGTLPATGVGLLAQPTQTSSVPGYQEDEYDRRLKGYRMSPNYQPYVAQPPNPYYRPVYAAEGGMMSSFDDEPGRDMASGGISSLGSYSDGGRMLKGPGDGMSDSIPGVIGDEQPARLADGEFVVPADVVSHIGNGSTDAGAKKLYEMMDKIRYARTGKKEQAPEIDADKYLPIKTAASGGIVGYAKGGIAGYASGGEVAALYESILGREPDAKGLEFWTNSGLSTSQIADAFRASPEAVVNQVFQEQLGRAPDASGAAYYQSQIASGKSAADIAREINRSLEGQEFDTQAIESAYNLNLGRTAEQEGFQYWLSAAQATPQTQKQLMDAIIKAAEAKEKVERGIQGKTFTQLEVADLVADPFGGRRPTTSIYDIPANEADRINISYINGIPVQFVSPVTEKALITRFGEGTFKASMGEETYSPDRVAETADRAFRAGSMTQAEYDRVMTGLDGIRKDLQAGKLDAAEAGDTIRTLLNVPKGFKIVDPKYGQQIGEDNELDKALAEAARRQEVLAAQDPGYYQANDILGQAYLNAGLDFPFMRSDYKANTMMTQADKLTAQNAPIKLGQTTNQMRRLGPYQSSYQPLNRNVGNMPASVLDPYSDEGLAYLYGQMMNQYAPTAPGQLNPATLTNNPPVPYTPPPINNLVLNTPIRDAAAPAPAPTTDTSGFFVAPGGQVFASEAAYNASVAPTGA